MRGVEFFADGPHDTAVLRILYGDWWRQYQRLGDPWPQELPSGFWTERVHTASFDIAGQTWALGLGQVFVSGERRIPWPRL